MRILMVGNGGREHALLWKLRRDAPHAEFFVTMPNGGMAGLAETIEIAPGDVEALSGWAASRQIDLAVIGPEAPLAKGLVDRLQLRGVPAFGPSRDAARIESSKVYAKDLMARMGVATAAYRTFTDAAEARAYVQDTGAPVVVKASGLAAGKGAIVCMELDEALDAVDQLMTERAFGEAGREIVVEEFMVGEELSVFALTDGTHSLCMMGSQDHKRVGEGDTGPNTGGMGAYGPVAISTPELIADVTDNVLAPTLAGMTEDGCPFRGLLYAGLMLTEQGPKVVEFNCRFGDPETQVVLPMTASSLLEPMLAVARGESLAGHALETRPGAALTTVLASEGYPGSYPSGRPIHIPSDLESDDVMVFHAGTARSNDDELVTSGGRVLAVTALGSNLAQASERSRAAAARIEFEGRQFRSDIGWRELARS
jgi:phosphoribosylamine---glycine ligase